MRKSEGCKEAVFHTSSSPAERFGAQNKTKPAWEQVWFTDGFWVVAVSWNIQVVSSITSDKLSCFHKRPDETSLFTSLNLVNACLGNWKTRIIRAFLLKGKLYKARDSKVLLLTVSFKDSFTATCEHIQKQKWNKQNSKHNWYTYSWHPGNSTLFLLLNCYTFTAFLHRQQAINKTRDIFTYLNQGFTQLLFINL